MTLAEIVFAHALGAAGVEEPDPSQSLVSSSPTKEMGVTRFVIAGDGFEFTFADTGHGLAICVWHPDSDEPRLLFKSEAEALQVCRRYRVNLNYFHIQPVTV